MTTRARMVHAAVAFALVAALVPGGARAAEENKAADAQAPTKTASAKPVYVPPSRGTPKHRVGGGTRGDNAATPYVRVLAPEEAGLSATAQPKLYWYVSQPTAVRIEVTVVDERASEPVLEFTPDVPAQAGIHAVDLAARGIRLAPDVDYQWSVALVVDANQRSKDVLASGAVRYVPPAADVLPAVGGTPLERAHALAGRGYWYDALAALDVADASADASSLAAARNALLQQVGLGDAVTP